MANNFIKIAALTLILPVLINTTVAAGNTSPIAGVWLTERLTEITIRPCEVGHCGYVTKIKIPPEIYSKNKDAIDQIGEDNIFDHFNKDPALRTRPIQGLQILTLDQREAANKFRGEIYNPEDGGTYTGVVTILDDDNIRLTGCGFFDLICKSEDWSRID
jgi:uncharacterized protein (DUF2147 family)